MAEPVMWIIPEAPVPVAEPSEKRKARSSAQLRFGILDNSKSNADHLLGMIIEAVKDKYPDATIVRTRKPSAAIGATSVVLDALERDTDVVIAAMAD